MSRFEVLADLKPGDMFSLPEDPDTVWEVDKHKNGMSFATEPTGKQLRIYLFTIVIPVHRGEPMKPVHHGEPFNPVRPRSQEEPCFNFFVAPEEAKEAPTSADARFSDIYRKLLNEPRYYNPENPFIGKDGFDELEEENYKYPCRYKY